MPKVGELARAADRPVHSQVPPVLRKLDGAGNPFSQVAIVECPGIPGRLPPVEEAACAMDDTQGGIGRRFSAGRRREGDPDPYGGGPLMYEPSQTGSRPLGTRDRREVVVLAFTRAAGSARSPGDPRDERAFVLSAFLLLRAASGWAEDAAPAIQEPPPASTNWCGAWSGRSMQKIGDAAVVLCDDAVLVDPPRGAHEALRYSAGRNSDRSLS